MKLISEEATNVEFLTEATKSGKNYFIEGVFMQAETKNRNGRIYPKEVLVKESKRYTKEFIEKKRAFGDLGHPDGPTVNLERVSHMITELVEVDQNFMGRAKIMDTPYGKIVKNLIDEGARLGVSSRGMGSLQPGKDVFKRYRAIFILLLQPTLLLILRPQMHLLPELWKVRNGFGIMVFSRKNKSKSTKIKSKSLQEKTESRHSLVLLKTSSVNFKVYILINNNSKFYYTK